MSEGEKNFMRAFEVGKLFGEGKIRHREGVKFDFDQSGGTLLVFYNKPTPKEVLAFKAGDAGLGILYLRDIIFLMFKFGDESWMDVPYTCHLSPPFVFDPLKDRQGFNMTVFLVDANSGVLEVARLIGWPNRMSKLFKEYVLDQQEKTFDSHEYDAVLRAIYQSRSTRDLVKIADTFKIRRQS